MCLRLRHYTLVPLRLRLTDDRSCGVLFTWFGFRTRRKLIPERLDKGYTGHYAWMDPATLYVKIDDDVVYVADHAVDHMLQAHNLVGGCGVWVWVGGQECR